MPWVNRFPIVGAVPYLGFFREADARREAVRYVEPGAERPSVTEPVDLLGVNADQRRSLAGADPQLGINVELVEPAQRQGLLDDQRNGRDESTGRCAVQPVLH